MTAAPVALAACGGLKSPSACRADQMYTGRYSRACWEAARALCPGRAFFISAGCGVVAPGRVIEPYDRRPGQRGAVTAAEVKVQAVMLGIHDAPVIVLAGKAYAGLARQVWAEVRTPLAGLFIGQQLRELGVITAVARLPRPVAEVTQALLEAHACASPGWLVTTEAVRLFWRDSATTEATSAALRAAAAAGLAGTDGETWWPAGRAYELRRRLEQLFYPLPRRQLRTRQARWRRSYSPSRTSPAHEPARTPRYTAAARPAQAGTTDRAAAATSTTAAMRSIP